MDSFAHQVAVEDACRLLSGPASSRWSQRALIRTGSESQPLRRGIGEVDPQEAVVPRAKRGSRGILCRAQIRESCRLDRGDCRETNQEKPNPLETSAVHAERSCDCGFR